MSLMDPHLRKSDNNRGQRPKSFNSKRRRFEKNIISVLI